MFQIFGYGHPIDLDTYIEEFMSSSTDEGSSREAVKNLTLDVEKHILPLTINAPDWYVSSL
jgi:glycerol-3-phosphate O-acyltransferase/dihydroxyacetone phosphate acyltransferase